jgi:hypothetical protein
MLTRTYFVLKTALSLFTPFKTPQLRSTKAKILIFANFDCIYSRHHWDIQDDLGVQMTDEG